MVSRCRVGSCRQLWRGKLRTQKVEGHWRYQGVLYRDNLVRVVVDVPDTEENREWMRQFKERWKIRLEQLELWLVSYVIEVD